jgi:hypothetical protein
MFVLIICSLSSPDRCSGSASPTGCPAGQFGNGDCNVGFCDSQCTICPANSYCPVREPIAFVFVRVWTYYVHGRVDYRRCSLRLRSAHARLVAHPHLDRSLRAIAPRLPSVRTLVSVTRPDGLFYAAVDGGWSAWSTCTPACGQGTSTRTCTEPRPSNGGRDCYGDSTKNCFIQQCGATAIALHLFSLTDLSLDVVGSGRFVILAVRGSHRWSCSHAGRWSGRRFLVRCTFMPF